MKGMVMQAAASAELRERANEVLAELLRQVPAYRHVRRAGFIEDVCETNISDGAFFREAVWPGAGGAQELEKRLSEFEEHLRYVGRQRQAEGLPLEALLKAYSIGYGRWWRRLCATAANSEEFVQQMEAFGGRVINVLPRLFAALVDGYLSGAAEGGTVSGLEGTLPSFGQLTSPNAGRVWGVLASDEESELAGLFKEPAGVKLVPARFNGVQLHLALVNDDFEGTLQERVAAHWPVRGLLVYDEPPQSRQLPWSELAAGCATAFRTAKRIGLSNLWLSVDEVALYEAHALVPAVVRREFIARTLGSLTSRTTAREESLLETTKVFLQTGGNLASAARLLHIHPNTLAYRLTQIELASGRSLRVPADRALVTTAFAMLEVTPMFDAASNTN